VYRAPSERPELKLGDSGIERSLKQQSVIRL
jgi:hypothetical protein